MFSKVSCVDLLQNAFKLLIVHLRCEGDHPLMDRNKKLLSFLDLKLLSDLLGDDYLVLTGYLDFRRTFEATT